VGQAERRRSETLNRLIRRARAEPEVSLLARNGVGIRAGRARNVGKRAGEIGLHITEDNYVRLAKARPNDVKQKKIDPGKIEEVRPPVLVLHQK
jgi:hypothetical protein